MTKILLVDLFNVAFSWWRDSKVGIIPLKSLQGLAVKLNGTGNSIWERLCFGKGIYSVPANDEYDVGSNPILCHNKGGKL